MDEYQAPLGDVFDVPQPTAGETLRRARLEKGLELADIARDTRIPVRHLAAIENDAHDSLPALPYAIGFVKTFARHVGLAGDVLGAQFRAETSKSEHAPTLAVPLEPLDERRVPSRGLIVASLIGVIAIVVAVWAYGAGLIALPEPEAAPTAEAVEAAATPPAPPPAAESAPPPATGPATDAAPTPATEAANTAAPPATGGTVTIAASEDAWFKVYDSDGQTLRMGILQAGDRYTVPSDQTGLKLWTGNAGALTLAVGGKAVAPVGAARQTVKDISLDPADLLARGGEGQ